MARQPPIRCVRHRISTSSDPAPIRRLTWRRRSYRPRERGPIPPSRKGGGRFTNRSSGISACIASWLRRTPAPPSQARPGNPQQRPELEAEVVFEVGHIDQTMDDDSRKRQQDPEVNGAPEAPILPSPRGEG